MTWGYVAMGAATVISSIIGATTNKDKGGSGTTSIPSSGGWDPEDSANAGGDTSTVSSAGLGGGMSGMFGSLMSQAPSLLGQLGQGPAPTGATQPITGSSESGVTVPSVPTPDFTKMAGGTMPSLDEFLRLRKQQQQVGSLKNTMLE